MEIEILNRPTIIIGVYAPTDDATAEEKDLFYEILTDELNKINSRKEIVIMGDFNGRTGKRQNNDIVGRHGEEAINDNGCRLIELCTQFSFKIANGFYEHKNIHKFTRRHYNGTLSIIDYLLVKQQTKITVKDVRVQRGAECGSDHYLLRAPLIFNYSFGKRIKEEDQKEQTQAEETLRSYNLESLKDESTQFLYKLRLANKMQYDMEGNVKEQYDQLKKYIHEAATEALGTKGNISQCRGNIWWTEELREKVQQKKDSYLRWVSTMDREDRREYVRQRSIVKKEIQKAKNFYWETKCSEIDSLMGSTRSREVWRCINTMTCNTNDKIRIDPIGAEQWEKHYKELLVEKRDDYKNVEIDMKHTEDEDYPEITIEEIKKELKGMKNNRAPGPGGIPIELVKHAPLRVLQIIKDIFNKCLKGEDLPDEWKIAQVSSIFKKGNRRDCNNYRGISVTSSMSRLYGRVLKSRLEKEVKETEEQSGFRPGRSCTDNIFCLKQLMEKRIARSRELHVIFVDLKKAFDSVPQKRLWELLEQENASIALVNAIKNIYKNNLTVVKTGKHFSQPFRASKGLKQGCCLSPALFKIYIKGALKEWTRKCRKMGVEMEEYWIYTMLFADDQLIIAEDEEDVTYMIRKLIDEYKKWGLELNMEKTKYMAIGGTGEDLQTEYGTIQHVNEYNYLGVLITSDGKDEKDILNKVAKGKRITRRLHSILWNKDVTKRTKRSIYKTIFESSVTYGAETWVSNKASEQKLEAAEMEFWRRSCSLTRAERVRNEEIRRRMNTEKRITDTINQKKLIWYGHLRRMNDERLPIRIWKWQPKERRKKGRPRKKWNDAVLKAMRERELKEDDWWDRKKWKSGCEKRPQRL